MVHIPQRIVCLQPSATVILRDLDRLDAIVACTRYCLEVCPELRARNLPVVSDSWTAQGLQISSLNADLVIASVPYQEKALAEIMKAGARFVGLAPKTLAEIYGDIAVIAGITQASARGDRVIASMERQIAEVRARTQLLDRPTVFCEEWGKPLIASQRWVAELVEAGGGEFVGVPGAQIGPSAVEAANPDVIVAAWCGAGDRVPLEKIISQRGWQHLAAVRNRRVYCIRDELLNTPAPTLIQGLHALAAALHPKDFPQPDGLRWIGNTSSD